MSGKSEKDEGKVSGKVGKVNGRSGKAITVKNVESQENKVKYENFVTMQIQQLYIPIKQSQTCPDGPVVHTFLYLLRKHIASISVHQHTYIPIASSDI